MLRTRVRSTLLRVQRWWLRLPPSTRALPHYVNQAVLNFIRHGLRQAAALSYYAVFSIFPLTLLGAVAVGSVLGPTVAQEQIARGLSLFLPEQTLELFQNNVSDALQQGRQFGLLAFAGLVWSGLGLFTNITSVLDLIFHVPTSRSMWRQRFMAVVMTLMLIVLVTTSFVLSAAFRIVDVVSLGRPNTWLVIGATFLPFGIDMVIFALLFRYVPARQVDWDAVWPAAIFGAGGWELLKSGFGSYLQAVGNFQFVYGSIATVIVLLFWAYLIASIFLLSAELCAQLNDWIGEQHKHEDEQRFLHTQPLAQRQMPPSSSG